MENLIKLHGHNFELFIKDIEIRDRIKSLGNQVTEDYQKKDLMLIGVLNGAMIFLADLIRSIELPLELGTIRASSYIGAKSSGTVQVGKEYLPDVKGKDVILVEDIVDTGKTLFELQKIIGEKGANSVSIATLLFKPEAFEFNYPLNYVGFEIPNKFVVGYGLDYDELGRNLPAIYQIQKPD